MTTEVFRASAQYDDWKGTVAADQSDMSSINEWLEDNGIPMTEKILVGFSSFAGENPGRHIDPLHMEVLLVDLSTYGDVSAAIQSGAIEVERHRIDINLVDFFGLFKRFSVSLSTNGILTDQEYQYFD